jgi:membrane-associated phospholipid phosphatase
MRAETPRSLTAAKLVVAVVCVSLALPVRADGLNAGATDKVALDIPADAVVIALGGIGSLVPEIFKSELTPAQCRWCGANAVDRFFHDSLTGAVVSRKTANTLSNVTGFGLAPAAALAGALIDAGPHATPGAGLRAAVIVVEGTVVALALTQSIKLMTARARPYAVYGHPSQPDEGGLYDFSDPSSHLSFPSAHSTFAAALGVGSAMTATLEESPAAPWLWGAAGVLTLSTGFLRMMAEKHWITDDLGGIAIGGGCGVLFPLLHRRGSLLGGSSFATPVVAALPGGMNVSLVGRF